MMAVALLARFGAGTAAEADRSTSGLLDGRACSQSCAQAAGTGAGSASTPKVGTFTATVDALRVSSNGAHVAGADVRAASSPPTRRGRPRRLRRGGSAWPAGPRPAPPLRILPGRPPAVGPGGAAAAGVG